MNRTGQPQESPTSRRRRRVRLRVLVAALVLVLALAAGLARWSGEVPGGIELPWSDGPADPCADDSELTPTPDASGEDWIRFLTRPELEGRRAGSDGVHEVGRALATELRRLGLEAPETGLCPSFPLLGGREFHVVADLPAAGESTARLLVAAHYDGQGLHPTRGPMPGADDNASGVVALLLAARRLVDEPPPGVSVRFVFFAAEEIQGFGSRQFVRELDAADRPDAALVLDMVGRPLPVDGRATGFSVRTDNAPLRRKLEAASASVGISLVPAADLGDAAPGFSDDVHLRSAGLPAALISSGLHADYHEPGDLPERVDLAQVHRAADLVEVWIRTYRRYTPQP